MKKFNITVNGKLYAVEVEEVGAGQGGFTYQPVQSVSQPAVQPQPATQPAPAAQSVPKAVKAPGGPVTGELITAPMPGTILDIKVTEGQAIKAGDVVLILEAMKMENEIVAPNDGVVNKIHTTKSSNVSTGDALVTIG
ncbi:biotin/lipoyl-containing protein [Sedimentibacter sp.]|uniref:biotin/lipoyl-containing protein n=1 Tax=Sedimentibacter sp. TaxID=1960295 RepID=UPI0028A102F2|nr:biotin/lipoyl-containing protein [Sedimentibacter sp.]